MKFIFNPFLLLRTEIASFISWKVLRPVLTEFMVVGFYDENVEKTSNEHTQKLIFAVKTENANDECGKSGLIWLNTRHWVDDMVDAWKEKAEKVSVPVGSKFG